MSFTLTNYSKYIKLISILPIILGLSTFVDLVLPNKQINTKVVSKGKSYRAKFGNTTYKIGFENNNDQFTPEIFNKIAEGDDVVLITDYIHEEVRAINIKSTNTNLINNTNEIYFQLILALVMLFPIFYLFKKRRLSTKQCKYILIISAISFAGIYRLINLHF